MALLKVVLPCLALLAAANNARKGSNTGGNLRAESFVRALDFNHSLRVCNAYPDDSPLELYRGKEHLTEKGSMPYKDCADFKDSGLKSGDKLEFKVGDVAAGTFSVSELPENDAVLMVVIHRHDTLSTAVSFESHVFANIMNAQVAVIDTYQGKAASSMRIRDHLEKDDEDKKDKKDEDTNSTSEENRTEELRYDSVVAVNEGDYEVVLVDSDGAVHAHSELVALKKESYIVLRTGVEAQKGKIYPEEIVVFPQSDGSKFKKKEKSAAAQNFLLAPLLLVAASLFRC